MAPDVEGGGLGRVLDDEENRGNLSWLRTMVVENRPPLFLLLLPWWYCRRCFWHSTTKVLVLCSRERYFFPKGASLRSWQKSSSKIMVTGRVIREKRGQTSNAAKAARNSSTFKNYRPWQIQPWHGVHGTSTTVTLLST